MLSIWIGVEKSTWETIDKGVLDGITLRNVQVLMPAQKDSEVVDFSSSAVQVSNIEFEGFKYDGIVAKTSDQAHTLVLNSPQNVGFVSLIQLSLV